ncbi:MAG: hypothetical protein ACYC35_22060 [Pirellulales bacterium]
MDAQELNLAAEPHAERAAPSGTASDSAIRPPESSSANVSGFPKTLARLPDVNVPKPGGQRVPLVRQVVRRCRQPRVLAIGGSALVLVLVLAIGLHALLGGKDKPTASSEDAPAWDSAATGVLPAKGAPVSAAPAPGSQAALTPGAIEPRPSIPPEGYRMAELPRPRLDIPDRGLDAEMQPGVARLEGVILKPTSDPSDEHTGPGLH